MAADPDPEPGLSGAERERLAAIRSAASLAELREVMGAGSEHDAYVAAKREWRDLRGTELAAADPADGLPGRCVTVDGREFCVHGITHAGTDAERALLQEHASQWLDAGAAVYCEQGIRPMYFAAFPEVYGMDDYRWATGRCDELDVDGRLDVPPEAAFDGLAEEVDSLAAGFREAVFSLIHSGSHLCEECTRVMGDVASFFVTSHEDSGTGTDFTSFRLSREAATDPDRLPALQAHYERAFLPQPLEREWLRRHDRELELVTHGRNERMADYAVYHADAPEVHLVVGAAHQPGIAYYLEQYRAGRRDPAAFEPCG